MFLLLLIFLLLLVHESAFLEEAGGWGHCLQLLSCIHDRWELGSRGPALLVDSTRATQRVFLIHLYILF